MTDKTSRPANTMLVAFRAENVRSFRDRVEFSMEATALSERGVARKIPWRQDRESYKEILPVAAVFGANASGKTNLLRAMDDMQRVVLASFRNKRRSVRPRRLFRRPFLLDPAYQDKPTWFEIELIIGGVLYEYGFELNDRTIVSEWAIYHPKGRPANLFRRQKGGIVFGEHLKASSHAKLLRNMVRADSLFLSVVGAIDLSELSALNSLYNWFDRNFNLCAASSRESRWAYTTHLLEHENRRDQVLELLQIADLGITDAQARQADPEVLEKFRTIFESMQEVQDDPNLTIDAEAIVGFSLSHQGVGGTYELDASDESLGTLVWLGLIGPLLDSLIEGTVLLADELESSLHPALVTEIVRMFQNPKSNPQGAQLIFNSHEARLLGNSSEDRVIGRDQAWFAEKSNDGASAIYPLSILGPRKSESIARRYLEGRYGATPILSHSEFGHFASRIASGSE
ncbi:ATP-binding protein [Nocardia sp. NPDC046763]|uniref:AAA family ATPase n=1 Tax=Nocardia sp. NPDC046763 TaxID=3155256 RepID=UPI0033DDA0BC